MVPWTRLRLMAGLETELALAGLGIAGGPIEGRGAAAQALDRNGDFAKGFASVAALARVSVAAVALDLDMPESTLVGGGPGLADISKTLRALMPWRKGPFLLSAPGQGSLSIDAEWRSDLKWRRVQELGVILSDKRVLDVGTGNGYFLLRLLGAGASQVSGLEPSLRSLLQFLAVRSLFGAPPCSLWPLRLEQLPATFGTYDTVMSMGVLYHQRDPVEHLRRLAPLMAPGGELIVESIVQGAGPSLHIQRGERYAGMRNVYVIPNTDDLCSWLDEAGYRIAGLGTPVLTTQVEQRATEFAEGPSLEDVLEPSCDPDDPGRRTREGHPRPLRLVVHAKRKRAAE
jgi:tRNA (mo5U34)-methyltransferase